MLRKYKQIAIAMVCGVTIFLAQSPAHSADTAPDAVGKAWKARAEAATKKLAAPGLDKCDKGVELAFHKPNEVTSGKQRSFELPVEIDKQTMVASYSYEGQRLTSFILLELPPGWLAVQKTDSKSLNILVTDSNCSFYLCTNDPFAAGPCKQ
jgi:hypothetical protein